MALWLFLLGFGALGFTIKVLMEHLRHAEEINDCITAAERARLEAGEAQAAEEAATAEIKAELEQAKAELGESQSNVGQLTTQISKRKEVLAKRGKFRV